MTDFVEGAWYLRWVPFTSTIISSMSDSIAYALVPQMRPLLNIRMGLKTQIEDFINNPEKSYVEYDTVLSRLDQAAQENTGGISSTATLLSEVN